MPPLPASPRYLHVNSPVIGCILPVHVNTPVIGCYALYKARELPRRRRRKKERRKIDQGINKSLCIDLCVCCVISAGRESAIFCAETREL